METEERQNLFAYGRLGFDEIIEALLGRIPDRDVATLAGHRRYAISKPGDEASGAAIVEEPGGTVDGLVLIGLESRELAILDHFETTEADYERVNVAIVADRGGSLICPAYRATAELQPFLAGAWSDQDFRRDHLDRYVNERIPTLLGSIEIDRPNDLRP